MNDQQNQPQSLAGTHRARAKEWALGMSSTGKEQIGVMFAIVGGEHDGRHITWFGYFTDNTVDRTIESLRHCGWSSDSLTELDTLDTNEVELVVEDEYYEGKTRSRVKWVNRPSRLQMKGPMSAGQAQEFAQRLMGRVIAHKQKAGGGQGQTPPSTGYGQPARGAGSRSYATTPATPGNIEPDDLPF
jgi:hypothetical protein